MPQRMPCALFGLSASGGPNMARHFHHQRLTASCTMAFCFSVPVIMTSRASALALVEGFLLADAHHGAGRRAVGAAAERHLVHDRGAIDQPADHADVGPGQGRVIEDRAVPARPLCRPSSIWSRLVPSVSAAEYR